MPQGTATAARGTGGNALAASGLPNACEIEDFARLSLNPPEDRAGQPVRIWARSLTVMQKEAIVYAAHSGRAWRFASDEGPYLNGHDFAPCPLSFLTTGMAASYLTEIGALARQRGIELAELTLIQHNYYTMEGAARDGSMLGGALPIELEVHAASSADTDELERLVADAVRASPLNGLLAPSLSSLFTLSRNGIELALGRARPLGRPAEPPRDTAFDRVVPPASDPGWIDKRKPVETMTGVPGGAGTSLAERQSRTLHLKATARVRADGTKVVEQELLSPLGSTFAFVSDEPEELGGRGLAPDAMSFVSAGIAFCFMTQLGRYAKIMRRQLDAHGVVQDTQFSLGGASGRTDAPGTAEPVATHVHLVTSEDDEFARACLDMGERTCFLHALCRTPLEPRIRVVRS